MSDSHDSDKTPSEVSTSSDQTNVEFSIGKNTDAAIAQIIKWMLEKPAKEVGDLLGNTVGLLGDRMRIKREQNLQVGIDRVRETLEARGVEMKDITPPEEEDLHLVLNGMSLAGDQTIRDLWAGLFAAALDPNSNVTVERPFISVLESLSPTDAKVIDLLAFTIKTENEVKKQIKTFFPVSVSKMTPEEEEELEITQKANQLLHKEAFEAIELKAKDYGLREMANTAWSENLMRQGLIERPPLKEPNLGTLPMHDSRDRNAEEVIGRLNTELMHMKQAAQWISTKPERIFSKSQMGPHSRLQFQVQLTSFGKRFAQSCGLI